MPLFPDIGQGYDRQDTPDREDLVIEGEGKFVDAHNLTQIGPAPAVKRPRLDQPTQRVFNQFATSSQPQRPADTPRFPLTPDSGPRKSQKGPIVAVEVSSDDGESDGPAHSIIAILSGTSSSERQGSVSGSSDISICPVQCGGNSSGKKRPYDSPDGPGGGGSERLGDGCNDSSEASDGESDITPLVNLREEQKQLHVIAKYPGEIALLPDTWAGHFRAFPLPHGVFYKKTRKDSSWPRIYERSDGQDFHGSKVFLDIIKVQSRVRDIRNEYLEEKDDMSKDHIERSNDEKEFGAKYVKALKPALEKIVKWAWKDGGLNRFDEDLPPTVAVFQVHGVHSQEDAQEEIQDEMEILAKQWRDRLAPLQHLTREEESKKHPNMKKEDIECLIPKVPTIYGFAIIEHNVVILTQDASNEQAEPFCVLNVNMETDNQRQWYAMMIMVTICYARDRLMLLANQMHLNAPPEEDSSDPDA